MKIKSLLTSITPALLTLSALNSPLSTAQAQGTAFTYQGQLQNNDAPANGLYDFRFRLDNDVAGDVILGTVFTNAIPVTSGLFTTTIDFGAGVLTGSNYWLEVDVRTNNTVNYTALTPLQALTPTPYAVFANTASNVSGTVSAVQLSGPVANGNLPANPIFSGTVTANSFSGSGANLTALDANNLASGTVLLARLSGITSNQLDAATWQLATNLNGGNAALASNVVSGISITNAFITNSVFAGNGGGLTNLNASQLSGPVASANLSGTYGNAVTLNNAGNSFSGNGANLTALNANNLASGTVPLAQLPAAVVTNYENGVTLSNLTLNGTLSLPAISASSSNVIYSGTRLLLYADNSDNFFSGGAGNLTTSGDDNSAIGADALSFNTSGSGNTVIGVIALLSNTNGSENTAIGALTLNNNTSGSANTANGERALLENVSGSYNTANGVDALLFNTSGSNNIALGYLAGYNLSTGSSNIDIGNEGLAADNNIIRIGSGQTQTYIAGTLYGDGGGLTNLNVSAAQLTSIGNTNFGVKNFFVGPSGNSTTSGSYNTANGDEALTNNTSGSYNVANGTYALYKNTSGSENTADGADALQFNTSGSENTANGNFALAANTIGWDNTAIGNEALVDNTSGSNNIALGNLAGYFISTGSSNIDIGNEGIAADTNIIRIGSGQAQAYIAGIINGNGGGLTNLPNVAMLNANQTFTATNFFSKPVGIESPSPLGVLEIQGGAQSSGQNDPHAIALGYSTGGYRHWIRTRHNTSPVDNAIDFYVNSSSSAGGSVGPTNGSVLALSLNAGNVGIGTTEPADLLVVGGSASPAYCNGTTWVNGSDRNSKEDFTAINPREVLAKISALPITEWKYKVEADGTEHLGPMAQDFHAAFGLNGPDDKHIATVDEEGVALAAIQGLNQKLTEELNQQVSENTKLEQRIEKLEKMMNHQNEGAQ